MATEREKWGSGSEGPMRGNGRRRAAAGRGLPRAILPGRRLPLACSWLVLKQLGASGAFPGLCGEVQSSAFGLGLDHVSACGQEPLFPG